MDDDFFGEYDPLRVNMIRFSVNAVGDKRTRVSSGIDSQEPKSTKKNRTRDQAPIPPPPVSATAPTPPAEEEDERPIAVSKAKKRSQKSLATSIKDMMRRIKIDMSKIMMESTVTMPMLQFLQASP